MTDATGRRRFQRVLLKISGEAFGGQGVNLDVNKLARIAADIKSVRDAGVEMALVVGGGNLLRGAEVAASGMNRASADQAGMLATVINGLALQDSLERIGVPTRVCSALTIQAVAEPFIRRRVMRHIEKGRVPILVGGTGNPYFTTDTTAALRAKEIGAEVVLKATKVDGVYTADPKKDPTATRFEKLTFMDVLQRRLKVMDSTAIAMCQDNQIPIVVFDYTVPGNVLKAALGDPNVGTLVSE
ncbi:MAG: UMP kinase [Planctomycetes bacterium]|nr:UMP kinase [Planctomycetota bacterium]MCC7172298.1 UMP kinase [Planctomycetota bacterium]